MKKTILFLLIPVLAAPLYAAIHVEAEDCIISSWNLSPPGAVVQIVVPHLTTVDAVEIARGVSNAVGVGQLRLPIAIPDGEYAVVLRYFTHRTYADSSIAVQFGSDSGSVVAYETNSNWHRFYPDDVNTDWHSWYDVELTASGSIFPVSPTEPLPEAVGIYGVNAGDFYINIWDDNANPYDLATIDYIELIPVANRSSDINDDGYVDLGDLKLVAENWLGYTYETDISPPGSGNGYVNMGDFAFLANDWWKAALHIADITTLTPDSGCSGGNWSAKFIVNVEDKRGDSVNGVEVTADWSGVHGYETTTMEITDANGQAFFTSQCLPIAGDTTLTIANLYKPGHDYYANENVKTSKVTSYSVPWSPTVRAEYWVTTAMDGNYAKINAPSGQVVLVCTDNVGNPAHAVGDIKFNFPGSIPDGDYEFTVRWKSGTMGGTAWSYLLGSNAGSVTEVGVTSGMVHYFYPGHSGLQSAQWFLHDYAGSNPIDFSMWPNSPVATHITTLGIGQGDFYILLRDLSPGDDNYFTIEYFKLTPLP